MRKRNCLSTIAKMVEMQQYKDNGEDRNCSNSIKVLLPRLPDVHGEPPKPNARTGPSQGLRKSVTLETAAKNLKQTYDFQWNRIAKTEGANLHGTNSTQEEQSPNKLRMSSWRDKFSFADVRVMYIKMLSGFAADSYWIKCTKPSTIEEEKRTEEFVKGMPQRRNTILEDDPRDKGLLGIYWGYSCIHFLLPNSGGQIRTA